MVSPACRYSSARSQCPLRVGPQRPGDADVIPLGRAYASRAPQVEARRRPLDPISEQATKESLSYLDFRDRLLEAESASRAERRLLAETRLARFPFQKALADFFHVG